MSRIHSPTLACATCLVLMGGIPKAIEAQPSANATVTIGNKTIVVPAPAGFVRSDGIDPEIDRAEAAMLPETNRRLIAFSTPEKVECVQNRLPGALERNFDCQIPRNLENRDVGEQAFKDARVKLRAEIEKLKLKVNEFIKPFIKQGNQRLSDQFGVDAALTVSDTAVLGVFDDTPTSLGFSMAMKVGRQTDANEAPEKWLTACIVVPVNGRLIYLYSSSPYQAEGDRIWAEQAVSAWRDAVVNANPRIAGPTRGGFDFTAAYRSGVIGGVIGGLVGGFMWLFKKNRKKDRAA